MDQKPVGELSGTLHIYVAFDVGEEVDLAAAKRHVDAEYFRLPRQARTPSSISYQPAPLRFSLDAAPLKLAQLGDAPATADVTLFDFAGVSVAFHVPFRATADALLQLADSLSDPAPIIERAAELFRPVFEKILPAIRAPQWSTLSEEYFVFQFPPSPGFAVEQLLAEYGRLAGLLRLDSAQFSPGEVQEALRLRLSYSPDDAILADWAAAVVIDRDCDETLEIMAFANLQLLEFRSIDQRLESRLQDAYRLIGRLSKRWLPFWRSHTRPLRDLGELKVEIHEMLQRTTNVLKLIGDQYLARVYQVLVSRFHLDEWGKSVRTSLGVLEGIYRVVADQADTLRSEALEWIIILLIVFEIVMALLGH